VQLQDTCYKAYGVEIVYRSSLLSCHTKQGNLKEHVQWYCSDQQTVLLSPSNDIPVQSGPQNRISHGADTSNKTLDVNYRHFSTQSCMGNVPKAWMGKTLKTVYNLIAYFSSLRLTRMNHILKPFTMVHDRSFSNAWVLSRVPENQRQTAKQVCSSLRTF
jgi:hypothetical protein